MRGIEAIEMLQSFEQERAKEKANDLGGSFLRAVRNVAKQEDRSQEIERDWAKDCDLSERSR